MRGARGQVPHQVPVKPQQAGYVLLQIYSFPASSSIGKSQLPYALTLPMVHLFTSQLQGQQPMYSNLNPLCKIFCNALSADMRVLQANYGETRSSRLRWHVGRFPELQKCFCELADMQTFVYTHRLHIGARQSYHQPKLLSRLYSAAYTL
ncbi:hypothetical protein QOT17_023387 [Balamuthia mandrillaris]